MQIPGVAGAGGIPQRLEEGMRGNVHVVCVCTELHPLLQKGWGCPAGAPILEGVTFLEQQLCFLPVFLRFSLL